MSKKFLAGSSLVIAALLFAAVNVLSNAGLKNARLDLTADHLYTVSQGSRNIIASLKQPITLRFYFSQRLSNQVPQIRAFGDRVRDLLEEYAALSHGMIRLQVIDPEPFTDQEDQAVQDGIQGVPLEQGSDVQFYFGLSGTNSTDQHQVIPFFQVSREPFLEYDLTKLIYALTNPKRPEIGVLTDLPMQYGPGGIMAAMRGMSQPYAIMTEMNQAFDVQVLSPTLTKIPAKVKVLFIADLKNVPPATAYAIDQFVLGGGRALIMVDPWAEEEVMQAQQQGQSPDPTMPRSSSLPKLFKSWGIHFDDSDFIADRALAIEVNTIHRGQQDVVNYVPWLSLGKAQENQNDVVTANLGTVNMASAGAFTALPHATTKMEPLLTSSDEAEPMSIDKIRYLPDPVKLLAALKPTGKTYVLAARITGEVKTAFPDGPPKEPASTKTAQDAKDEKGAAKKPAELMASKGPINVIVVGDSDMLADRFWVQSQEVMGQRVTTPIAANGDFVLNALSNLSGSTDLTSLRSRGLAQRPFTVIERLRRHASEQFLTREQALQKSLDDTEKKIKALQSKAKSNASGQLLTSEERQTIEGFRENILSTRKELRRVRLGLNESINRLEWRIKLINLAAVPILVALAAIVLAWVRRRRRKPRHAAPS